MPEKIYITTPIYYVNASPHIGHSYTNIAADALARYYRAKGKDVFFLTGTDEHGQKINQAAVKAGKPPQEFVDGVVKHFDELWKMLNISHDDFIRTTEERHIEIVQRVLQRLYDQGKVKQATYEGWYCTSDETFWTEAELKQAGVEPGDNIVSPESGQPMDRVQEEGWYLGLRSSQEWLVNFVKKHPQWVQPESRYNELLGMLEQPLPEFLCITRPRTRVNWGIPLPFDDAHVVYVWFDALLNYLSAPGYLADEAYFKSCWPAHLHLIGKDILRHHAVYWPIILHELGFSDKAMPRRIFAHGWWKMGEQKMSKSLGNIVDPTVVVGKLLKGQPHAADIYRYFVLREVPFGQDGSFSDEAILNRLESDLANDLGNLVNRTLSMIDRYFDGIIPPWHDDQLQADDVDLREGALMLESKLDRAMEEIDFSQALEDIFELIGQANRYIERQMPWKLAKDPEQQARLEQVIRVLAEVIRETAVAVSPFMPGVSGAMWAQLGLALPVAEYDELRQWPALESNRIGPHPVLFPKIEE